MNMKGASGGVMVSKPSCVSSSLIRSLIILPPAMGK